MSYFQITRVSVVLLAAFLALFTGWQIGSAKLERKRQNQVAPAVSATEVSGKIAYVDHSPDGLYFASTDIFMMNQDGTQKTQLTHIKTLAGDPTWSPDGQKIAYTGCNSSQDCKTIGEPVFIDLYSIGVDGSNPPKRLTTNLSVVGRPSWSPDGSKIAFAANTNSRIKIFVIPAEGGAPTQITSDPAGNSDQTQDTFPIWSPDGARIVFIRFVDFVPTRLYSIKPDGSDLQLIKDFSGSGLAWSPDGKQIAFSSGADDGQIFLMNPDGTNQRGILQGGQPSWSPDSQQLVFSRFENPCSTGGGSGCYGIFTANLDGTNSKRIGSGIRPAWQPSKIKTPLILIPGIAGSYLRGPSGKNVWLSPAPDDLEALALGAGTDSLLPTELLGWLGIGPLRKDVGYGTLIDQLTDPQKGGYRAYNLDGDPSRLTEEHCDDKNQKKDSPNLFVFPYNWTKSNADNSKALASYIRCVQRFYSGTKVDIVAHSMGGVLARRYILDNLSPGPDGEPAHSVDKLVTIGTPFLGAPKAVYALETGYFLDILNPVLGPLFKPVVLRSPGAHELIPTDSYFGLGATPFVEIGFDVNGNGSFPEVYDYTQLVNMLDSRFKLGTNLPGSQNRKFHGPFLGNSGQDDFHINPGGVKYFHLIGRQGTEATVGEVYATNRVICGFLTSNCQRVETFTVGERVFGDGTVPHLSASKIGAFNQNLNSPNAVLRIYPSPSDPPSTDSAVSHLGLVKNETVINDVISILKSGKLAGTNAPPNIQTAAVPDVAAMGRYLQVIGTDFIAISDDDGNSNAPIPETPLVQEVPGITYDMIGLATTSIAMQTGHTFTFTFRAGPKPLLVELTEGTSEAMTKAVRYTDLGLTAGTIVRLTVTSMGEPDLRYDANGDGVFETSLSPTASVTGSAAQDTDLPTVTINATRQANNAVVTIASSDSGSGVKNSYYSTDGTHFQQYAGPFTVDLGQVSTIYAFADDNVANRSGLVTFALPAPVTVQLESAAYTVSEAQGFATINVRRGGDTSAPATVNYATSDTNGLTDCAAVTSKASERCDYVTTIGRLSFAPGETAKSFVIPLIEDVWVEGNEAFTVTLSSPTGATVVSPNIATVNISDNDGNSGAANPIDGVEFFILQQYRDILNRQPDSTGLQNWINTLGPCPNGGFGEPPTSSCDRLHVAAGFFQSDEFLNRGYFAFRFYMVAFNQRPTYAQFIPDMAQVGGPKSPAEEEASKVAYANAFVQRPEFLARYGSASGQTLANALLQTAGLPAGSYNAGSQTNGQILRGIAESSAALNKFLTEGTVSIMYFGFQRRDPDAIGYQNNLNTLNANPNNLRHMIFIFIYSTEYRSRFGP